VRMNQAQLQPFRYVLKVRRKSSAMSCADW
jgi:hypothetical protein